MNCEERGIKIVYREKKEIKKKEREKEDYTGKEKIDYSGQ